MRLFFIRPFPDFGRKSVLIGDTVETLLLLLDVADEGKAVEVRVHRTLGAAAAVPEQLVPVEVGPVEDRLRQRPVDLRQRAHQVLQAHQHLRQGQSGAALSREELWGREGKEKEEKSK